MYLFLLSVFKIKNKIKTKLMKFVEEQILLYKLFALNIFF